MIKNKLYILLAALLMIGLPLIAFAQVDVSLPTILAESGETAVLPITVGDLTGENVTAFQFTISYDTNVVKITGFDETGTLSEGMSITPNAGVNQNFITVAAASGSGALVGSGVLGNLTVEYIADGASTLAWTTFQFNEGDPVANATDGSVSVGAVEVIIEDIQADTGSVIVYPITVSDLTDKNITSYQFTLTYDENIINVTGSDATGTLSDGMNITPNASVAGQYTIASASASAISGAGVLLNLNVEVIGNGACDIVFSEFMFNEGVPVSLVGTAKALIGLVDVVLPTDGGNIGDTETLPILISDVTGRDVKAYEFTISYDDTKLNITGIDAAGTLSEDWSVTPNPGTGTITVAAASADALVGEGTLLNLQVEYLAEGSSVLTFDSFTFNEGNPVPDKIDGSIVVISNVAPVFTAVLPDTSIDELEVLEFTYTATDANDDTLTFALVDAIEGMTVSTAGVLSWTPTISGDYSVVVSVTDGVETVNDTANVTVLFVGSSLIFSQYIEGSGQNKALEIYNVSADTINLGDYIVKGGHNGDDNWEYATYQFPVSDLAPGDVYVLATTDADDAIKAVADTLFTYDDNKIVYFNGDDARAIFKGSQLIDIIGVNAEDPGSAWDVAGVTGATGEHTLVRKPSVTIGNTDWAASAGTDADNSEWIVLDQNTFGNLGNPYSIPEVAGVVAVSATELQVRFSEDVNTVDVANFSIVPTATISSVTMPQGNIALLTVDAIIPNTITPNVVNVTGISDFIGIAMVDTTVDFKLSVPGDLLPHDYFVSEWESDAGSWWSPTGSGSTYGILGTSSFAMSDSLAYAGDNSAKLTILDDPNRSDGWFVRLYNPAGPAIAADSKLYFYMRGADTDVQLRFCIKDNGTGGSAGSGYEVSQWYDITMLEDDWQVVCFDLANDPVTAWLGIGTGEINSTDVVRVSSIQLKCAEDIDVDLYFDMLTERRNVDPVDVTMQVDMEEPVHWTQFNPATDFVDVAGSFNGWAGTVLTDDNADDVWEGLVGSFYPGETLEYKFRINGSWDDDKSEFPGGGANRVFVVGTKDTTLYHLWEDKDPTAIEVEPLVPQTFALEQNYPNPFNPTTSIKYELPKESRVRIVVYDVMGNVVRTLVNEKQTTGYKSVIWDSKDKNGIRVSSGVYIYHMQADHFNQTKKMMLVK